MNNLYNKLNQFPNDEIYRFADLTEEDKENLELMQIFMIMTAILAG